MGRLKKAERTYGMEGPLSPANYTPIPLTDENYIDEIRTEITRYHDYYLGEARMLPECCEKDFNKRTLKALDWHTCNTCANDFYLKEICQREESVVTYVWR